MTIFVDTVSVPSIVATKTTDFHVDSDRNHRISLLNALWGVYFYLTSIYITDIPFMLRGSFTSVYEHIDGPRHAQRNRGRLTADYVRAPLRRGYAPTPVTVSLCESIWWLRYSFMARFNYRLSSWPKTVTSHYAVFSILAFLMRAVARAHYNGAIAPTPHSTVRKCCSNWFVCLQKDMFLFDIYWKYVILIVVSFFVDFL